MFEYVKQKRNPKRWNTNVLCRLMLYYIFFDRIRSYLFRCLSSLLLPVQFFIVMFYLNAQHFQLPSFTIYHSTFNIHGKKLLIFSVLDLQLFCELKLCILFASNVCRFCSLVVLLFFFYYYYFRLALFSYFSYIFHLPNDLSGCLSPFSKIIQLQWWIVQPETNNQLQKEQF